MTTPTTETTPISLVTDLQALYVKLNSALDKITTSFIAYKLQQPSTYENDLIELNKIRDDILKKQADLVSKNDNYKSDIDKLNFIITELNISNKELKKKLKNFENSGLAANGELVLQKTILKQYIIKNIIILLLILFFLYKLYNKDNILL
jgi:hypothetical protein